MAEHSPFSGVGSGKNQPTGDSGGISGVKEDTGPAAKKGPHSTSHPSPGGKGDGPSGTVGPVNWSPKG